MDIKFVLTLLFICLMINIFKPLKEDFFILFTTYNINPDKLKEKQQCT